MCIQILSLTLHGQFLHDILFIFYPHSLYHGAPRYQKGLLNEMNQSMS